MPLTTVFFDLDGTLLDTSEDLGCALNYVLAKEGKQTLPQDIIRPHVSNGSFALIKLGFGDTISDDEMEKHRQPLLEYYLNNITTYTKPFSGITELIKQCATNNIDWGIVTNKPKAYTIPLMQKITFASAPSSIVCPDHIGISKPRPEPLLHACKLSNCKPENAIYIGDHLRDIECGKNANIKTIAVGYGFTTANEHLNWQATYTVNTADEIWPILQKHLDD